MTDQALVQSGCHFWTLKKDSHPKSQNYRLWVINWTVIIDPDKMEERIEVLKNKIQSLKQSKKSILIVWTKSLYADRVAQLAQKHDCHYLNYKVLWGFLTNFDTLIWRISYMNKMSKFIASDEFSKLTKKEQVSTKRSFLKIERIYKWVSNLTQKPDYVIVLDGKMMDGFVREVRKSKIDNLIIANTDFEYRWGEDNLLMANTNSYSSVDLVLSKLLS